MAAWEYEHVSSSVAERGASQHEQAAEKIHEDWIGLLNEKGAEGWELVAERFSASKDPTGNLFFANYSGTLKRPRQ